MRPSLFNLRGPEGAPVDRSRCRITNNTQTGIADIYLYDEISYFGITAQSFVDDLNTVNADQIVLHINSGGGDVFDAIAIYNSLRNHRANVTARIEGVAASAASFIALAGDSVEIERNAQFMIHDALGICMGNAEDMRGMVDRLDGASDNIADIYAQKTGGTVKAMRKLMQAETWYSGQEAVDAKFADKLVGTESNVSNATDLSAFRFRYNGRAAAPQPQATQDQPELAFDIDPDLFRLALKEGFAS